MPALLAHRTTLPFMARSSRRRLRFYPRTSSILPTIACVPSFSTKIPPDRIESCFPVNRYPVPIAVTGKVAAIGNIGAVELPLVGGTGRIRDADAERCVGAERNGLVARLVGDHGGTGRRFRLKIKSVHEKRLWIRTRVIG